MNSDKIVVGVVLIPPDEIIQLAIDINKTFTETVAENFVLDFKTCIPHITLLMGLITREQLPEVERRLSVLADKFSALTLKITGLHISERSDNKVTSSFVIEKTVELQKIHEAVLAEMSSIFTYDNVRLEMFFSPPPVNKVPMFWVKGFAKTSVRENYSPHITLGKGRPKQEVGPLEFTASKLVLCHFGNYCTCRDVLWSTSLM